MKKREKLMRKKALAMGLSGALLGSVGYVLPAAAATITVENTDQYNALGVDAKDISGNVVPVGSYTNNTVTIGTVGGGDSPIIGEWDYGDVLGNVEGNNNVYGAYVEGSKEVSYNTVTVHSGKMRSVYGGFSEAGLANGNKVIITGDAVIQGYVIGGEGAEATNNSVIIKGGVIENAIYGGSGYESAVIGNSVAVSGGKMKQVHGGYSYDDTVVSNNVVTISGGEMTLVYGGRVISGGSGDVINNHVSVSGGKMTIVRGGSAIGGSGDVAGNSVIISGGELSTVYGGQSGSGPVRNNWVKISGGIINNVVAAAVSTANSGVYGAIINNRVLISGGTFGTSVYGGRKNGTGYSENFGKITGNSVLISGGTFGGEVNETGSIRAGSIYGGYSSNAGHVTNNYVVISGGTVNRAYNPLNSLYTEGHVYGGKSEYGRVADNTVIISDGKISGNVYGGYNEYADTEEIRVLSGNKVIISGGTFGDRAYGGNVYGGYGNGFEDGGVVTDNQVVISGGIFSGNIYAGYIGYMDGGNMKDNSITISRNPTFGETTVLYGGFIESGTNNSISGNTLNIQTSGITVKNVANFDAYNFYLTNTEQDSIILKLTGGGTDATDITGQQVKVTGIVGTAAALQDGATVTLMQNSNGLTADKSSTGQVHQGVSLIYDYTTELNDNKLQVKFSNGRTSADSKSPVETQVAAAAFLNSGADLLAGQGIGSAVAVAGAGKADIFGAMGGGNMRYKSGSYADVHGWNLALGVGKAVANNSGKLTFGPFVEYGCGSYTSHLDSGVRGDGTTKYYGVGMLARQDNKSGVYYEGSLRYGRMDADYASNDLGATGIRSCYETSSAYYGAHLALGKITKLNDKVYADIYTKLMYNHQNGDSVALGGEGNGEVYSFDSVDSTRVRAGIRLSKDYNAHNTVYAGVAYEYEFDSEARATVKGLSTPAPSIKGSSGMLELGYILQPKSANDPAIDIGLQGWAGKKQGVSGSVNFVWTF